jgi:hypothetical protein
VHARAHHTLGRTIAALAVAATLAATSLVASVASATVTAETKVLDVGLIRLHVPQRWTVASASLVCAGHSTGCRRPCAPGYDRVVYLSTFAPVLGCSLSFRRNAIWVVPTARSGATTKQTSRFDGTTVILTIPRYAVTLYGFGPLGARTVDEFEPSSLAHLLAARLPASVPSAWRHVDAGALRVAVPNGWPVHGLTESMATNPGVCGWPYFVHVGLFVGRSTGLVGCVADDDLDGLTAPGNGAWLFTSAPWLRRLNEAFPRRGMAVVSRTIDGVAVHVAYPRSPNGSDVVLITVPSDPAVRLILGLGLHALVAEQVLGSLRVS